MGRGVMNSGKRIVKRIIGKKRYDYLFYCRHHRRLMRKHGIRNEKAAGEEEYVRYWQRLTKRVDRYNYRLYSHFCGNTPYIIPIDVLHNVVEPMLNPVQLWDIYEDKNRFSQYVEEDYLPKTIARRSAGGRIEWLDDKRDSMILKASVGTSCGEGVLLFKKDGKEYVDSNGVVLSERMLAAYGDDFVLQEAVEQHEVLRRLSPAAVATIRLATYRSEKDERGHITAAVLRVGAKGKVVDNIVAGGRFVKIDLRDGRLGEEFCDRQGMRSAVFNGVNLQEEGMAVPSWKEVCRLAEHVSQRIKEHRFVAMDIAVREDGRAVLIEYNIGGFSPYLFHFTGQPIFGKFTDEVICNV